jgi:four helix bundle protein
MRTLSPFQIAKTSPAHQIRKCNVSIPSNIAEGAAHIHIKEFIQLCYIAQDSLSELETQLILCQELYSLAEDQKIDAKIKQTAKQLMGLVNYLKPESYSPTQTSSNQRTVLLCYPVTLLPADQGGKIPIFTPATTKFNLNDKNILSNTDNTSHYPLIDVLPPAKRTHIL